MAASHSVQSCRWGTPTLFLSWPLWYEGLATRLELHTRRKRDRPRRSKLRRSGLEQSCTTVHGDAMIACDALIVDGGPAGSTCARALHRAGWNVLLIDRALFPRVPRRSGCSSPRSRLRHGRQPLSIGDERRFRVANREDLRNTSTTASRPQRQGELAVLFA
jgi:hypothetical protein